MNIVIIDNSKPELVEVAVAATCTGCQRAFCTCDEQYREEKEANECY